MEEIPLWHQLLVPTIFFFIALSIRSLFAFLETSITALRLFKIKELARITGRYENLFTILEKNPHRVLITTLLTSSVADVTAAALATHITEKIFEHFNLSGGLGFSLGIGIASLAIVLFGEIIPKNLARTRGERILGSMLWIINSVFTVLGPIATILTYFSDYILHLTQGKNDAPLAHDGHWITSETEILFLIDYIHSKGLMESEKTEMIRNIFELGTIQIKEIMVPETDIISIDVNSSIQDALKVFAKHQFTRLPIYQGSTDNIIGMAHQKDIFLMLSQDIEKPLEDLIRPIMFSPETMKINQLLRDFRQKHLHISIVLNEHGSVTGLVTLEDILEEIVGDISDEHEEKNQQIIVLEQGGWLIDAGISLDDLTDFLMIPFDCEDAVTLAGFLTEQLQHIPKKGENITYKNYYFQVHKASPKRVLEVYVSEKKKNQNT